MHVVTGLTNRKGFPKHLIQTPAEKRALKRGDHDWKMFEQGVLATMWNEPTNLRAVKST